jgi:hypothetical protein
MHVIFHQIFYMLIRVMLSYLFDISWVISVYFLSWSFSPLFYVSRSFYVAYLFNVQPERPKVFPQFLLYSRLSSRVLITLQNLP